VVVVVEPSGPSVVEVVVGASVVDVVVGATVVVVVVGATVVVVVVGAIDVDVVLVGATEVVVVVVGATVVVVVVGGIVVVLVEVDELVEVVVLDDVVVDVLVVVGAAVVVVVGAPSVACALGGGVIFCVVPVCAKNPPVALTSAVAAPNVPGFGNKGAVPAAVPVNCAGPAMSPGSPNPVSTQSACVLAVATPMSPPKSTSRFTFVMTLTEKLYTPTTPIFALLPSVPLVVNTLPVLKFVSV
jgi:hypothetical protein